jgi:hypothetical protein
VGNIVQITPTWSVVNATAGSINSSTGLFTAGTVSGPYLNTVQATSSGISGFATVNVAAGALATITVNPNPSNLAIGGTQTFTAVGKDANGNIVGIVPVWSVVNATAGSINSGTGLFTAGTVAGPYLNTVQATSGGISGFATVNVGVGALFSITVSPNPSNLATGGTQPFTAVGKDANGNIVQFTPTWSVLNATAGSINSGTGLFTAGTVSGTYLNTVQATSSGISGFATVNVAAGALFSITVSPNPSNLATGGTQLFTAVGKDVNGNIVGIVPAWSIDPLVGGGTIDLNTGVFTAGVVAGAYNNTVRATVGAIVGKATVNVGVGALFSITVSPNPSNLAAGGTQLFTAVGKDVNGNIVGIVPAWSIDPLVGGGTIDLNTGVFTAGAVAGAYNNTVRATSGGVTGRATVNVTAAFVYVDLGKATPDGILAATKVSCATDGVINANVSIWAGNALSGPCVVSGLKTLGVAPADQEQADMKIAFDILMGKPCPAPNVIADIGGTVVTPGVYCTAGTDLGITGAVTLDGGGNDNSVFVFQSPASSMTTAGSVILQNGAHARNVYWVIGTSATLGTASAMQGNILADQSISLIDNATLVGRALAHNGAVTLTVGNTINLPPLSP